MTGQSQHDGSAARYVKLQHDDDADGCGNVGQSERRLTAVGKQSSIVDCDIKCICIYISSSANTLKKADIAYTPY